MKKLRQILAIIFALTLFGGYVVHSQLEQSQQMAPSSKLMVLPEARKSWTPSGQETNPGITGSNAAVTLVSGTNKEWRFVETGSNAPSRLVLPGSKSARIIEVTPPQTPVAVKAGQVQTDNRGTNAAGELSGKH